MNWLRGILGTNFPDPAVGQVWRSTHSGRAFLVHSVERSDCGQMWHLSLQHETRDRPGFNMVPMSYYLDRSQWCAMLREEARTLEKTAGVEPSEPWPRNAGAVPSFAAWQPIGTAPKNRDVWVGDASNMRLAFWMEGKHAEHHGSVGGGWFDHCASEQGRGPRDLHFAPTHWMPLPAPPAAGVQPARADHTQLRGLAAWLRTQAAHPCATVENAREWSAWADAVDALGVPGRVAG